MAGKNTFHFNFYTRNFGEYNFDTRRRKIIIFIKNVRNEIQKAEEKRKKKKEKLVIFGKYSITQLFTRIRTKLFIRTHFACNLIFFVMEEYAISNTKKTERGKNSIYICTFGKD